MHVYEPSPVPKDRQTHNRYMNAAVIKFAVPLTLVCVDCYHPPRMCRHLHEPDLAPLFTSRK